MAKELIGPPPPPPRLAAAPVTSQDIDWAIREKLRDALCQWALMKMGKQHKTYVERAMRNFQTMFWLLWGLEPKDNTSPARVLEICQQTPFAIPLKISDRVPIPENLVDIHNHYKTVLKQIEQWKKRKGRVKQRIVSLMGILPGIGWEYASKWRQEKASTIAHNYIARKYGLPSGDTAKKKVSLVMQPEKFVREMVKNIAREAGIKILSSPPKSAKS